MKQHVYQAITTWTGNKGEGTKGYKDYERSHTITIAHKPDLVCSSDPTFRGDKTKHNPEELLVCSLSSCHMLWYLHLCAVNNVIVQEYTDEAKGTMVENSDGSGQFSNVTLQPRVTVTDESMVDKALALHHDANKMCFIARSMNFPIEHNPTIIIKNENSTVV